MSAVPIKSIIEEYLETITPFKRPNTQEMHFIYLGELSREIGHYSLTEFNRIVYIRWIQDFKKRKSKRKTFDDYTKFINQIYMYAFNNGHIDKKIIFHKTDADKGRVGRVYTDAELIRLLNVLHGATKIQFILSFECYMRLTEVLALTWHKIDFKNKVINLGREDIKTGSKTDRGRMIPLSDFAYDLLARHKNKSKNKWVFYCEKTGNRVLTNRKAWSIAKRNAKILGRARWHDIRHTALTKSILENKMNPSALCLIAGLSLKTLEKVYLHSQLELLRNSMSLEIRRIK